MDQKSPNLRQVRFDAGLIKKEYSTVAHGSVAERPMLFDIFKTYAGVEHLICVTVDKAYQWVSATSLWTLITDSGVFTGDEDNRFESCSMNDLWIVTNGKDAVQKWTGAAWAVLGGLAGLTITAVQTMIPFYSHLFIANFSEGGNLLPLRIRWSDTGDPEDWATGVAGALDLVDTQGDILRLYLIRDRLFAFKTDSVWELVYVGGTRIVDPRLVLSVGIDAPDAIASLGNEIGLIFKDGIYRFDGGYRTEIGKELYSVIFETGEREIRQTRMNRALSTYVEETAEYVLALPEDSDDCNVMYKLKVKDGTWSKVYQDASAIGKHSTAVRMTWAAAKSGGTKWNDVLWDRPWKSRQLAEGSHTMLIGEPDGTIVEDDRATLGTELFSFETKDFIFEHNVRWQYIVVMAKGDPFTLQWSIDAGSTWSIKKTLTPSDYKFSECMAEIKVTSMQIRFKVETENNTLEIKWLEPTYVIRKRSRNYTRS